MPCQEFQLPDSLTPGYYYIDAAVLVCSHWICSNLGIIETAAWWNLLHLSACEQYWLWNVNGRCGSSVLCRTASILVM